MSEQTLDDVLTGEEVVEETQETETTDDKVEAETSAEPASSAGNEPDPITVELSSKVDALTKELTRVRALNRQEKEEDKPEEPINIWDDPDGRLKQLETKFDTKLQTVRNNLSETYARNAHADYDEKLDVFLEMVKENPALVAQMNASQDPAGYAYEQGKQQMLLKDVGNLDDYKKRLEAETRKAVEAQVRKEYEAKIGQALPDSLADATAAGDNTSVIHESLDDVVGVDIRHRH